MKVKWHLPFASLAFAVYVDMSLMEAQTAEIFSL